MENKCGECTTVVENHDQMKYHMRNYHWHNKSSQYDDKVTKFEEYSCFYCGTVINSKSDLQDHIRVCIQVIESLDLNQDIDSIQCDECTAEFVILEEFKRHKDAYHSNNKDLDIGTFLCDICPLYFERNRDLQFHRRGCHWNST